MTTELAKKETVETAISRIDSICSEVPALNAKGFKDALNVARYMGELKALLTPEVMKDIMALQNSPVGFVTDRSTGGYDVDTVKDCVIWAIMNGLPVVGNCFNIIAGKGYAAKNGMQKKLKDIDGLSFSVLPGIPKMAGESGAIVKMECAWEYEGKKRKVTYEIPVRVNKGMGCDAIIGKAKRKVYAQMYEEVTGNFVADGEADDNAVVIDTTASKASVFEKEDKTDSSDQLSLEQETF